MGTPYIYYIQSSRQQGLYIGQSQGNDSRYARVLNHFSGLYHYNDKGRYVNTNEKSIGEGAPFVDWLKTIPLETIEVEIFEGPLFGIPKETWIEFMSQWSTSVNYKNVI